MILLIVVISDPKGSTLTVTRFSCQSPLYYLNVSLVTNLIVASIINGSSPSGILPYIANASAFGNVLLECSERAISSLKPEATFAPNICLIYNCSTSNPHLVSILTIGLHLASVQPLKFNVILGLNIWTLFWL